VREGRYREGESKGYDVTFSRSNRCAYIEARLERDGEYDLLTRVRAGGMTAQAIRSLMGGRSGWPGICPIRCGGPLRGSWASETAKLSRPSVPETSIAGVAEVRLALLGSLQVWPATGLWSKQPVRTPADFRALSIR